MKRIYYASGSVVTGDKIAEMVIVYAEVLALRDTSDMIDVPIALASGEVGRAQLLIGPASQLIVVPYKAEQGESAVLEELEDDETITELSRRTSFHSSPRPQAGDAADITHYDPDTPDYGTLDTTASSATSPSEGTDPWER